MTEFEAYEILVNAYIKIAENPNVKNLVSQNIIKAEEVYGLDKSKDLFKTVTDSVNRSTKNGLV